jgi:hypothetical protein
MELAMIVVLSLIAILVLLGIVYAITLIFSRMLWIIFQVIVIALIILSISIILLNDDNAKKVVTNASEQIGNVAEDITNWYETTQFYSLATETIGMGKNIGFQIHFRMNVFQSSVSNTFDGIKETFYNITSFWQ